MKLGDKSPEVSQLQKYLSLLGYDLVIDGHFGDKTLRSLRAFQKKYGLTVDGIAGPKTFTALKAAQKRTSKEIKEVRHGKDYGDLDVDTNHNQPSEQYIKQITPKDKIFIHYTVSGADSKNVLRYWNQTSERISTAFVMSGRGPEDGKIYEAFNPDFWSYHLGVKGSNGKFDKSSVGIEICAWGRLEKRGDKFFNVYNREVPADEVYTLDKPWRGNSYYHAYSDKQIESLEKLLLWIIEEYKIPVQNIEFDNNWVEYNNNLASGKETAGIFSHTNLRMDKQDTYPDHRLFEMLNRIRIKVNGK
jgi:N-acetyl-anhydromuramyl-L-alanine amidase AmpD